MKSVDIQGGNFRFPVNSEITYFSKFLFFHLIYKFLLSRYLQNKRIIRQMGQICSSKGFPFAIVSLTVIPFLLFVVHLSLSTPNSASPEREDLGFLQLTKYILKAVATKKCNVLLFLIYCSSSFHVEDQTRLMCCSKNFGKLSKIENQQMSITDCWLTTICFQYCYIFCVCKNNLCY